MSLAMDVARSRQYRGDPGFFGTLGSIIKGVGSVVGAVIPGVSAVSGIIGSGLGSLDSGTKSKNNVPILMSAPRAGVGSSFSLPLPSPSIQRINATSMPGTGQVVNMTASGYGPGDPNSTAVQISRNAGLTRAGLAPSGYHLNKTGYWVNGSNLIPGAHYVAPGTQLVKNRRSNPLNPHALSRSLRRLQGFARATKHMRAEAHKIATAVAPQSKRGCTSCRKGRK